jgi:hypothetical protein
LTASRTRLGQRLIAHRAWGPDNQIVIAAYQALLGLRNVEPTAQPASTGLTMFKTQLGRMLLKNGLLRIPTSGSASGFAETAGFIRTAAAEFAQWQARSPVWRLAGLAFAFTLTFMLARSVIGLALLIFTNVWMAGAAAALLAALIIFPQLITNMVRNIQTARADQA